MGVCRLKRIFVHLQIFGYILVSLVYSLQSCLLALVPRRFRRRDIQGQVALVTGGAMGIGKLTAKKLAAKGAKVIIWDVDSQACADTRNEISAQGGICHAYDVDVADLAAVRETAQRVKELHGMVNILVNNAGILCEKNFLTDAEEVILKHFEVNTLSHFWTVRSFLPDMKKSGEGHIVSMSSVAGKFPCSNMLTYSSSKFAVCGLDENLRVHLDVEGFHDITTTLVCPFFVNTRMAKGVKARLHSNLSANYVSDEIVDAILMRKRRLFLPSSFKLFNAFRGLLHHQVESLIYRVSIGEDAMHKVEWRLKEVTAV